MKISIDLPESGRKSIAVFLTVLLFAAAAFNVFYALGSQRLRSWDESRHGVSACEMMTTGNYIVNTYDFKPDYWNVKPVFSFYCNIFGMKLFGRNIFGMRFASALSFMIIAAVMFLMLRREAGIAAALVGTAAFVVSPTNWVHGFRNGDPDAVFIMFCFAAFVLLWYSLKKEWLLPLSAFCFGMAFLTKSFHVGVPGLAALLFVAVNWKRYSWRTLLSAAAAGMFPVLLWAFFRFRADGWLFFRSMVERDLLGRVAADGGCEHTASPWYDYLSTLNHYLIVIPLATAASSVVICLLNREKRCLFTPQGKLWAWATLNFMLPLLAFSSCAVKLPWYVFPCLVYLPVMLGISFYFALRWLRDALGAKKNVFFVILPALVILAEIVWIGIGEGKAIRVLVKREDQCDVLSVEQGGAPYRGATVYCVDAEGRPHLPHQKFMQMLRFLDCSVDLAGIDGFRRAPDDALLVCSFEGLKEKAELRAAAERTAEKLSLRLIRCADGHALYRKARTAL